MPFISRGVKEAEGGGWVRICVGSLTATRLRALAGDKSLGAYLRELSIREYEARGGGDVELPLTSVRRSVASARASELDFVGRALLEFIAFMGIEPGDEVVVERLRSWSIERNAKRALARQAKLELETA